MTHADITRHWVSKKRNPYPTTAEMKANLALMEKWQREEEEAARIAQEEADYGDFKFTERINDPL